MPESMEFLRGLVGKWEGTCRTWFEPGELADESPIKARIEPLLEGLFFRHTYEGMLHERPRRGEETLAYNSVTKQFEVAWVDDFHMNYGIMVSVGSQSEDGFVVAGHYAVDSKSPPWGWKTVYQKVAADHIMITAYNVAPHGQEAKALETTYHRRKRE